MRLRVLHEGEKVPHGQTQKQKAAWFESEFESEQCTFFLHVTFR